MPEIVEVYKTSESLHKYFGGNYLARFNIIEGSRYTGKPFKGYELLKRGLFCEAVTARGKKIIFHFHNRETNQYIKLISFLGMSGHYVTEKSKHTGIMIQMGKKLQNLYCITKTLYYEDIRHFGTFDVCITMDEFNHVFKTTGPDYLTGEITFEMYTEAITKKRISHYEICKFLMEQKYFSGIGNYLLQEILYAAQISPHRLLNSLSSEDISNLFRCTHEVIQESYENNGLTIADWKSPDNIKGTYSPRVYGQKFDPYGNEVIIETLSNKRTSHWVPAVQK